MKYMDYDLSQLPVVYAKVNPITPTIEQYQKDMLDMNSWLLENHKGMIWILNFKHVTLLPSEHRILAGNWLKKNASLMKQNLRCSIMVECSMWTSVVLKGMFLIASPPIPTHVASDLAAARKIMIEQYAVTYDAPKI
jgi:hypothetical protein